MVGTREWRTPPVVGVFLKLSWMKNLEEAFVSFPLVVERGSSSLLPLRGGALHRLPPLQVDSILFTFRLKSLSGAFPFRDSMWN